MANLQRTSDVLRGRFHYKIRQWVNKFFKDQPPEIREQKIQEYKATYQTRAQALMDGYSGQERRFVWRDGFKSIIDDIAQQIKNG